MKDSGKNINFSRIYFVLVAILLFWAALEVRLFKIQISDHEYYNKQSSGQSAKKVEIAARRGDIYDRKMECMATDLIQYDMGIDLNKVQSKDRVAQAFAQNLKRSKSYFLNRLNTSRQFVYLARKTSKAQMEKISALNDPGIVSLEGYRRYYPFGKYGSQIIGFTDVDNKGISGLELQYQDQLRGKDGWTVLLADARRRFGYNVDYPHQPSEAGVQIQLTIDKNFQTIVEDELDQGVKKYNGSWGIAVLMNPFTGEILAMYSSPGFNPNESRASTPEQRRNRVITDIIEPGSTFKLFPAAALLQERIKGPDSIVFCENGKFRYYNHTVNDTKKYGWLSFRKVFELSSNIGMVKLSTDISKSTFYQYIKNFGFDSNTGIDLMGESTGILSKPNEFSGLSKGIISFGQEIGVTALQITNAYSAVVNGGNLMRPYIISHIRDIDGETLVENEPQRIRQVISPEVAATLSDFMVGAVNNGTGQKAQINGISVGGKTGTAQKFNRETRRYVRGQYLASFIGYAPAEHPDYVLAIFVDNPRPSYYGGDVAAPIFANIMRRILNFAPSDVPDPDMEDEQTFARASGNLPNFSGFTPAAIEDYFEFKNLDYTLSGQGNYIIAQGSSDPLELKLGTLKTGQDQMPDLRGLTVREALKKLDFSRYQVSINGSGRVKTQSIRPGTAIRSKADLNLSCSD